MIAKEEKTLVKTGWPARKLGLAGNMGNTESEVEHKKPAAKRTRKGNTKK
jgi:hypothetical protein